MCWGWMFGSGSRALGLVGGGDGVVEHREPVFVRCRVGGLRIREFLILGGFVIRSRARGHA